MESKRDFTIRNELAKGLSRGLVGVGKGAYQPLVSNHQSLALFPVPTRTVRVLAPRLSPRAIKACPGGEV